MVANWNCMQVFHQCKVATVLLAIGFADDYPKTLPPLDEEVGCLLTTPLNDLYKPGTIVDGNCAWDYELKLPLDQPFCPKAAPMSVVLVPKCASTSFQNWLSVLDGTSQRWVDMVMNFDYAVHNTCAAGEDSDPTRKCGLTSVEAWDRSIDLIYNFSDGIPPRGTNASFFTYEGQAEIQFRIGQRFHTGYLPYPRNCLPCCIQPNMLVPERVRLPVVVLRNPFGRLMAYYWRSYIEGGGKELDSIEQFVLWSHALEAFSHSNIFDLDNMRASDGMIADVAGFSINFTLEDLHHVRPVSRTLRGLFPTALEEDLKKVLPSCKSTECWFDRHIFVVHMETVKNDMVLLNTRLCAQLHHCEKFPDIPHLNMRPAGQVQEYNTYWASPNGAFAAKLISKAYASDFIIGGYTHDPLEQAPVGPSMPEVWKWIDEQR